MNLLKLCKDSAARYLLREPYTHVSQFPVGAGRSPDLVRPLTWPHVYNGGWGQTPNLSSNTIVERAPTVLADIHSHSSIFTFYLRES